MASCSSDGGGNEWADMDFGSGAGGVVIPPSFLSITIASECEKEESEIEYCVSEYYEVL